MNFNQLMEAQGLRQPKTKFQRILRIMFADFKIARKILGGTWVYIRLEKNYGCWFWATDKAKWLETDHTIEIREKW